MRKNIITGEYTMTYGDAVEALSPLSRGNGYCYDGGRDKDGNPQYELYDGIRWDEANIDPKPSEAAIKAKYAELVTAYTTNEYARNRKIDYDKLNQFELMTDDAANSTTTHADAIAVVKTKWPKNNSGPVE